MAVSPIDIIIFAPLAPILGVLLFWFIQLVFIESHKYLLKKIKPKHEPLIRFTNFIGILFQTICHSLGYTVTISGVSHFYVSVHYGKVKPKKEKTGVFEWVANTFLFLGPFFIPSSLLLLCLFFLMKSGFALPLPVDEAFFTFSNQLIHFGTSLYTFTEGFLSFLATIDLLHPAQLGFFILMLFLGLGIRPSYVGQEKIEKVDMVYDLKNIKSHILHKPLYIIILFLFAYIFFYISFLFKLNWYMMLFSILGWLSIIAIIALLIVHLLILLIKTTDALPKRWKFLPYVNLPLSYITMRVIFYFLPTDHNLSLSLLIMILTTLLIILILIKYKTNRFKSTRKMKQMEVEDATRRTIEK